MNLSSPTEFRWESPADFAAVELYEYAAEILLIQHQKKIKLPESTYRYLSYSNRLQSLRAFLRRRHARLVIFEYWHLRIVPKMLE